MIPMRPHDIHKDYVKMKAFPFSLDGVAKDWLYPQPNPINTWIDMKRRLLEKFFQCPSGSPLLFIGLKIMQSTLFTVLLGALFCMCPNHLNLFCHPFLFSIGTASSPSFTFKLHSSSLCNASPPYSA